MNGLKVKGISLYLTHIPNRKGLAFCFDDDGILFPVAYVSQKYESIAIAKWQKMIGEER